MQEYKTRSERKKAEAMKQLPNIVDEQMDILNQESPVALESPVVEIEPEEDSSNDKIVQGTFWMTFGSIFSRLLGALYVIPWNAMLGGGKEFGNALFAVGYTPYQLFLSIGTAGFPSAISKQIAHYNAKKQYQAGQTLFKKTALFMIGTGVVSALLMWVLAPLIAAYSPSGSVEDSTLVIRSLAPALLVVPVMSLIRGYFQGFQDMVPSAITQVVEQIVRVAYMLLATFMVMRVFSGSVPVAVAHSTFAAFVGALASLLMLMWYYQKHMKKYRPLFEASTTTVTVDTGSAIKEMIREAIPFIVVGSGITFGKFIDQFTFEPFMLAATELDKITIGELYGIFSFQADKLIMIIISLAVGLAATSIPLLVENYIKQDQLVLGNQIRKIFELFTFVMFPAALGMMVVARPIYSLFYGVSEFTPVAVNLLQIASVMSIILGAFTITTSILQSFGKHKIAILYLGVGLVVKLVIQYPLIRIFETAGTLYATSIGFLVTTILCIIYIYKLVPFNVRGTAKNLGIISLITGWMVATAHITHILLSTFLTSDRKITALLMVLIIAAAGGLVYIYLGLKTRVADEVLGARISGLRNRLKIK